MFAQVISLHNAFLYVALERSLLTHTHVVRHISVLLSSAHELAKEAAALLDSSGPRGERLLLQFTSTSCGACVV